ncbi:MAG: hypothetical protein KAU50_08710 [Candidatus Marinimicrobia bacterium]|nr:hypothetical protein [Candidatus Neomarinimicrobiota bacterium]
MKLVARGQAKGAEYVCQSCRKKEQEDPMALLEALLKAAAKDRGALGTPAIEGY